MFVFHIFLAISAFLFTGASGIPTSGTYTPRSQLANSPGPAAPLVNDTTPVIAEPSTSVNSCGGSTVYYQPASAMPKISDCQQITRNIANGGRWTVEGVTDNRHQLVQYGTWAFNVKMVVRGNSWYYVGNQDIIDLINDSIRDFGANGVVSTMGEMKCHVIGIDPGVEWQIYHTN